MTRHRCRLRLSLLFLASFGVAACAPSPERPATAPATPLPTIEGLDRKVTFESDVKPVLENRCVVCHGCYDGPCQLVLSSLEGAERGASQQVVYDTTRLETMSPTRLGIDARNPAEWRAKDFFSVLGTEGATAGRLDDALLVRMLALGFAHPFAPGERLPDSVGLDINRPLTCADPEQFDAYAREHPLGGMPYGVAPLAGEELRTLVSWVIQRPPAPPMPVPTKQVAEQVQTWESFLNGDSLKQRIVSRYLYEHWFVAHLAFENTPTGPFFRVVRSRTPLGQPIDEIATRRPYDAPGGAFWYRLQPIDGTILHKTHIVYTLSPARLARLRQLFLADDWKPSRLPSYEPKVASNPFISFAEIPPRARYQYLLDDAQYFVMTFIRGPVCRGQVAVDVIEDQFFVTFLDPDRDLSVVDPKFLAETMGLLDLPAEHRSRFLPGDLWLEYNVKQHRYLNARERFYAAADPERRGPALDWIWDGEGQNQNALLTVFRNFDNATVVKGFVGAMPETAWVMDYPIFERIYYDLVAGYDVFGDVGHQVATRLYMDHLRMQSENLFLSFLPAEQRQATRASWYVGATKQIDYVFSDRLHGADHGTQIRFSGADPVADFLGQILVRSPAVAGPPDTLNRCAHPPCDRKGASAAERGVERELQRLASEKGPWVARMPEVSLLRVHVEPTGQRDLVYSLVHNDAHSNVAFLFGEAERRLPAEDTLSVVRGHFGSYPNFFFAVDVTKLAEFVRALRAVSSDAEFTRVVEAYGVRRTDPRFWATSDWLREDLRRREPMTAGLYDLGRFGNF